VNYQAGKARAIAVAAGAIVVSLALGATTSAAPVIGGQTVLKPDQDTFEGFADMSIGVDTTGNARFGGNGAKFQIKAGDVEEGPSGVLDHSGGLAFFTEGGPGVKFSKLFFELEDEKAKVFAKSGGAEVRFMDLDLSDATVDQTPATTLKIKDAQASLAKQGAAVLTETFDFPFRKGIPLGTIKVTAALAG
jgi:hypothetical protein